MYSLFFFLNKNVRIVFFLLVVTLSATGSWSQEKPGHVSDTVKLVPDGTEGVLLAVRKDDSIADKLPPNEFDGSISSFRIGFGYIHDFSSYIQSDVFKKQMDSANLRMVNQGKLRDFRILGSGTFKTKRELSWKFAYMWDGEYNQWLLRETGVTIGVPELAGRFFIGRTKEGYSMVKVMNGHSPWTMERQMSIDVIPILADGIKYMGYLPKSGVFWNLGYFNDVFSHSQKFSTYEWQYVARVGWLPINDDKKKKTLHIAANLRYGRPDNGQITLKSRPESNPAPQILNTGIVYADHSTHIGGEIYYRIKNFMIGSEVNTHHFYSDKGNHHFSGGDVMVSYFFTGAARPYVTAGSIFGFMPVKKSIFRGGLGEIEAVVRFSTLDLNDGDIQGGKFWRLTPMINWYIAKQIRLEFVYGYGTLDRFGMKGTVQMIEGRIQFTVM